MTKKAVKIDYRDDTLPCPPEGKPRDYGSEEQLDKRVYDFISEYNDLSYSDIHHCLTLWTKVTYVYNRFQKVPYLSVEGPTATGKSQLLSTLELVVRRGHHVVNIGQGNLQREIHKYHTTLLIDEFQHLDPRQTYQILAVLNQGYGQGGTVSRVINAQRPDWYIQYYDVFGPKAFASTEQIKGALQTRTIEIFTSRRQRKISQEFDREKAYDLRRQLLRWAQDFGKVSIPKLEVEAYSKDDRLNEIFHPLFCVAKTDVEKKALREMISIHEMLHSGNEEDERTRTLAETADQLLRQGEGKTIVYRELKSKLEGKGKFINRRTRTAKKDYDRFFIYVPVEVARDSAFPFKTNDVLTVKVDKPKNRLIVEKSGR